VTGQQVHRITGLDPANPEFQGQHISQRLDDTDARFVEAVHTNVKANGLWYPVGHVDFYPVSTQQSGKLNSHIIFPFTNSFFKQKNGLTRLRDVKEGNDTYQPHFLMLLHARHCRFLTFK